ncbi:S-norcoclaurine synthase [Artemisia annua]|uniref:S-norcoclaurine synthase n=1 Tax=Artemisia annua TaxID=35608 RepID=A0A2U1L0M6_ARTAN|nr:S-norcoclaurine synthase [Artemisia annua]
MYGTLSIEKKVKVPASKAWALYGTLELGKVVAGKILEAVDVVEGDGGIGTILKLTMKPGLGFEYYKEKFTKIDNENMIKETEVIEGGFLDMGFNFYRIRMEMKEDPKDDTGSSCITKEDPKDDTGSSCIVKEDPKDDTGSSCILKEDPKDNTGSSCIMKEDPKDGMGSSCILKLSLEYEVKEEFVANASFVTSAPLIGLMSVGNEHLLKSN